MRLTQDQMIHFIILTSDQTIDRRKARILSTFFLGETEESK